MLEIRQLTCLAGYRPLFSGLDFQIDAGQWLMLTGPNGTGKTTLLRALAGLVRPVGGQIRWGDQPIRATSPSWRSMIHYLGHSGALKDTLSADENLSIQLELDLGAQLPTEQIRALLHRAGLANRENLPVVRLSAGQRRRVQLARLMASRRPLWLLDEPGTALDSDGEAILAGLLNRHLGAGGYAVVATHHPLLVSAPPIPLDISQSGSRSNVTTS